MKMKSTLLIFLSIVITSTSLLAQQREDFTIQFITLGNCYICKLRIEDKLSYVEGVSSSEYDPFEKITSVTYDDLITDAFIIMQAVADTGHDTEWFKAPDAAYELLVGTCCEYERTIDYTQVEVGYLSLMDLWMPHVSIEDALAETDIKVYPSMGNTYFNIQLPSVSEKGSARLDVYSMAGHLIKSKDIYSAYDQIESNHMAAGNYLMVFSRNNNIISRIKISKQ